MRLFGLIGHPLSHSFSKKYFAAKFESEGIKDCTYENFDIPSIESFTSLITRRNLTGLNVTIPYKEQVISYLHECTEVVSRIQACNCISLRNGKLYGFNTDTTGFERSLLKYLRPHHCKALVLGTGGAAKAVGYVLNQLNIAYQYISRSGSANSNTLQYHEITAAMIKSHTLIINTTPLGMFPEVNLAPPIDYLQVTSDHYLFDLTYNPEKTLFLQHGERQGAVIQNGLPMLVIQAEESWKIWNS